MLYFPETCFCRCAGGKEADFKEGETCNQRCWCILQANCKTFIQSIMFSKACEYALRATLFLAQKSSEESKLSVDDIAAGIAAPRSFTAKILQQLIKGNVILSAKGPTGGFYLNDKAKKQPVWNVLQAFNEDQRLTSCIMGLHKCNDAKPCPLHAQYKGIKEQLIEMFKQKRISELAETMQKTKSFVRHQ